MEQIVARVVFTHLYQGRFGHQSEALFSNVNEIAPDVVRMLNTVLYDQQPRAFDRLFERLKDRVERARENNKP